MPEFRSPSRRDRQLERLIRAAWRKPREAFVQIVELHRRGRAQEVALLYRGLQVESPKERSLKALYAFAHSAALASFLFERQSAAQAKTVAFLAQRQERADAGRLREESLRELPRAAEAWVMAALHHHYLGDKDLAEARALKAVALDPSWSYGRYALGQSLVAKRDDVKDPARRSALLRTALRELQAAERTNPDLTRWNLYYNYVHLYTGLGRYGDALRYMDRIIARARANQDPPETLRLLESWRKSLEAKRPATGSAG